MPSAARIAAYRFGLSIRLLKNIYLWKDILALHILEKLALDELLSGKVLPHIRSVTPNIHDAITRTERIIASLSGVWSGGNVTAERRYYLFFSIVGLSKVSMVCIIFFFFLVTCYLSENSRRQPAYELDIRIWIQILNVASYLDSRWIRLIRSSSESDPTH